MTEATPKAADLVSPFVLRIRWKDGAVTDLGALVPILLVPSCDFDPTSDWNAGNTASFVSQVQAIIASWQQINQPVTAGGSFVFDLTIYAAQGQMQPLIQATSLQYDLA